MTTHKKTTSIAISTPEKMEEQPCHVNIDSPTPTTPPHQQVEGTTSPPFHSHEELSLAEESIEKLVAGSKFFPPFAATDDWFRGSPREGVPLKDLVSALTQQVVTTHVRTLHEHEIRVEKLLGRGGFCEVRRAYLDRGARSNVNKDGDQGNKPIGHGQEYAIKYLLPEISQTKSRKFRRGTADLAIEARFLSLLSHDNIIRLHYVSAGSLREIYHCLDSNETSEDHGRFRRENQWGGSTASCDGKGCGRESKSKLRHNYGYFLVLEHLHETLDNRIKHTFIPEVKLITGMDPLKHHDNHCCITSNCIVHQNACPNRRWSTNLPQWMQYKHSAIMSKNESLSNRMKNALAKRLLILKEIAHAILYLHEHHIVLRDIKPDNIGFFRSSDECEEDVPKLFDFGLVAELKESNKVVSATCFGGHHHCGDDVYKLTGCTGSRRYMSPEVAFSEPYNAKADIYSFGVLLYELSSLLQPFQGLTMDRHEDEVLRCGNRPCLLGYDYYWPSDLTCLIEECWCNDMRERPTIDRVVERLDDCIRDLTSPPPTTEDKQHQKMTAKSLLGSLAHLQLSPLPSGSTCYRHNKTARQA